MNFYDMINCEIPIALWAHPHLRYIEWKGVKIYDFQKFTFSTLFKLYIAGLGVLIPKRYHMLGVGPPIEKLC